MTGLAKPGDDEMRELARREASTGDVAAFSPICLGPWGNAALLLGIGALAIFWVPARLLARAAGLRRPRSEDAG
jgi:hypothetical protein